MAEYQENFSKLLSISSSENRDSTDSSNADADREDEKFYEKIEAPKFVDFTVPDHYCPDDHYWFCLRVGCDRKHEEEMDSEEIYKNFVLRVMAARSPNVRFRRILERNASRSPIKCPSSAPPKSSKPRASKIAIIASISEKMADEKKRVVRPLLKPKSTPVMKTKPVAAKYLTTSRSNKCSQNQSSFRSVQHPKPNKNEEPRSRVVSKALVFRSPKKAIKVKTSAELRTPISKLCEGMNKLEVSSQRKRVLGYSSKSVKNLSHNKSRSELSSSKVQRRAEESICSKSGRSIKSKVKGKLSQEVTSKKLLGNGNHEIKHKLSVKDFEPQESTHEEASMSSTVQPSAQNSEWTLPDKSKGEENCSELEGNNDSSSQDSNRQEDDTNNENENNGNILTSESCGKSAVQLNVNNSSEGERNAQEFMDSDDKENAAASDENRMPDKNQKQNGRKIFGMHDKCSRQIKKVAQTQEKNLKESLISTCQVMKLKKPKSTHPKPFRLRTDERGILKEANLEKKADPLAHQSETADLGGKLQKKQGNDNQKGSVIGIKTPRVKERSKAAASVTTPQRNHPSTLVEPKPKSSAIQRLERFRKISSSPLRKQSVRPKEAISTTKEITPFLTPGQKLDVIPEASPEISEQGSAPRTTAQHLLNCQISTAVRGLCTNKVK